MARFLVGPGNTEIVTGDKGRAIEVEPVAALRRQEANTLAHWLLQLHGHGGRWRNFLLYTINRNDGLGGKVYLPPDVPNDTTHRILAIQLNSLYQPWTPQTLRRKVLDHPIDWAVMPPAMAINLQRIPDDWAVALLRRVAIGIVSGEVSLDMHYALPGQQENWRRLILNEIDRLRLGNSGLLTTGF
jgi:hypothetical protein